MEAANSLNSRVSVDDVSRAARRPGATKSKEPQKALSAVNDRRLQGQKWTFCSRVKNLFIAGRKEQKLQERMLIAASVKSTVSGSAQDDSAWELSELGAESGDEAQARVFENPLYNPHLDTSGDNRFHSEIVKKAKGQHLLDAWANWIGPSAGSLKQEQVHYHYGLDKSEDKSRDYIVASIGANVAARFTPASSAKFAAVVLDDIYQHRHSPARIPLSNLISVDWTFDRDKEGAVTASYELKFKAPSGEPARARGKIDLDADGKLVRASRIVVSEMGNTILAAPADSSAEQPKPPQVATTTVSVSDDQPDPPKKTIKKNPHAQKLRSIAWGTKEAAKESVKQAAKDFLEQLKSDARLETEARYGKNFTVEQLNTVLRMRSARQKTYRDVIRECIPDRDNLLKLAGDNVEPLLGYLSGPLALGHHVEKFEKILEREHRTRIIGKQYAEGVLDCYRTIVNGDDSSAKNRENWLPAELRKAYQQAKSPVNVARWLKDLIEIRTEFLAIEDYKQRGLAIPETLVLAYKEKCKVANVDSALIANKDISFRMALSYAVGWETAVSKAESKRLL